MDKNEPISHHDIEKLNEALARKDVAFLFIGKGAAVLHGFPDTTQDVDIFPRKDTKNAQALIEALTELGFTIDRAPAVRAVRIVPVSGSSAQTRSRDACCRLRPSGSRELLRERDLAPTARAARFAPRLSANAPLRRATESDPSPRHQSTAWTNSP